MKTLDIVFLAVFWFVPLHFRAMHNRVAKPNRRIAIPQSL